MKRNTAGIRDGFCTLCRHPAPLSNCRWDKPNTTGQFTWATESFDCGYQPVFILTRFAQACHIAIMQKFCMFCKHDICISR